VAVVLTLLCGALGVAIGGTLFGSHPSSSNTAARSVAPPPVIGNGNPNGGTANGTANGTSAAAQTLADSVDPAVADINTTLADGAAAGTGMVLTPDGYVLTNNHVIADATDIKVQINGSGQTYSATAVGYDVSDDVALIKLDGASGLPTIKTGDSSTVKIGDAVVALGNALGRGGTPAVAAGSVTDLDQTIQAGDANGPTQTLNGLIQVSAPLQPGDSGGPLVNQSGQVIGMDSAASMTSRGGRRRGGVSGDGFAIPINTALDIARQIRDGQSSTKIHIGDRALLGVQVQNGQGQAVVAGVESGSPADSAGIAAGDIIESVGSTSVTSFDSLPAALDQFHPGDRVSIGWLDTSGAHHSATVQLTKGPPA
jgi:S1-C subfamily serine protease